jgi:hypothetical protein
MPNSRLAAWARMEFCRSRQKRNLYFSIFNGLEFCRYAQIGDGGGTLLFRDSPRYWYIHKNWRNVPWIQVEIYQGHKQQKQGARVTRGRKLRPRYKSKHDWHCRSRVFIIENCSERSGRNVWINNQRNKEEREQCWVPMGIQRNR